MENKALDIQTIKKNGIEVKQKNVFGTAALWVTAKSSHRPVSPLPCWSASVKTLIGGLMLFCSAVATFLPYLTGASVEQDGKVEIDCVCETIWRFKKGARWMEWAANSVAGLFWKS